MRASIAFFVLALAACAGGEPVRQACAGPIPQPWTAPRAKDSARGEADLSGSRFAAGEAVRFRLHPDGEVAYVSLPQGEGEAASFGGVAGFTVERAGLYRVGMDKPAWVDVAQGGKPAATESFGPLPCLGLRKRVEFRLEPGPAVLEISGNEDAEIGILVTRVGE